MSSELRAEIDAWIDTNWDPELPVREWWQRLSSAGFTNPGLPEPFGKGWGREETRVLAAALRENGSIGSPAGLGMMLAAPTILAHGDEAQIEKYVPCLLYTSPSPRDRQKSRMPSREVQPAGRMASRWSTAQPLSLIHI